MIKTNPGSGAHASREPGIGSACGLDAEAGRVIFEGVADRAPRWHRPVVTRMDIRRTMLSGGSGGDGGGSTFGAG